MRTETKGGRFTPLPSPKSGHAHLVRRLLSGSFGPAQQNLPKSPNRSTQRQVEGVGMSNMEPAHTHFEPES